MSYTSVRRRSRQANTRTHMFVLRKTNFTRKCLIPFLPVAGDPSVVYMTRAKVQSDVQSVYCVLIIYVFAALPLGPRRTMCVVFPSRRFGLVGLLFIVDGGFGGLCLHSMCMPHRTTDAAGAGALSRVVWNGRRLFWFSCNMWTCYRCSALCVFARVCVCFRSHVIWM